MNVEIGQIWKVKSKVNIEKLSENDYMIILSRDQMHGKYYYKTGTFWWSGEKSGKERLFGGARQLDLLEKEINDNAEFCFHLKDITK